MNVATRLSRQALLRSRPRRITSIQRRFGHQPLSKFNEFNITQRHGHGPMHYFREWEVLIFSHKDYRLATLFIWGPSAFATVIMFYCMEQCMERSESRIRPHKKAWHISEAELIRGEYYRGGSFVWVPIRNCPKRLRYIRDVCRKGFDEPGQIGFDEAPIPKLDE